MLCVQRASATCLRTRVRGLIVRVIPCLLSMDHLNLTLLYNLFALHPHSEFCKLFPLHYPPQSLPRAAPHSDDPQQALYGSSDENHPFSPTFPSFYTSDCSLPTNGSWVCAPYFCARVSVLRNAYILLHGCLWCTGVWRCVWLGYGCVDD